MWHRYGYLILEKMALFHVAVEPSVGFSRGWENGVKGSGWSLVMSRSYLDHIASPTIGKERAEFQIRSDQKEFLVDEEK